MATHDAGRLGSSADSILKLTVPGRTNGSDLNNDLIDLIPAQNNGTFDNGTDEAGNQILESQANNYMEQVAKEEPQSTSYAQRFITNFANRFNSKYNNVSAAELEGYQKALDADPEGTLLFGGESQVDLADLNPVNIANTAKDVLGSIDSVKAGRLYANLFYGKDEYRERILKINQVTKVNMDDLMNNDEAYRTMNQLVMRLEKLEKLPGYLKTDGKLDMDKVYKALPYLAAIQDKRGDTAAALALSHAAGLKSINDVYHNEFSRFAASVWYGLYKGGMNVYKQWTTGKAMARALKGGNGELTAEEQNDLQWANNQIDSTPAFAFDSVGSAFGGMIGGAAENLPLIATSQGSKAAVKLAIRQGVKRIPVVGTVLGKVADKIGNRALDVLGDIASVASMSAGIGANQYEENLYKLDSAGNRMYTPREAAAISLVQGVSEGVLEQYSLKQMGRAIAGGGKVIELNDLYKKGALLRTAEGRGEFREQVAALVSERIGDMVKAGVVSMGAEMQEEFSQQVSDMVIENIAQIGLRGDNAEVSSLGDIIQESSVQALQAMHAIAGFGVSGFLLHPVAHLRPIVTARGQVRKMMDNEAYRSVHVNQYQMNVIEGVGNNLKEVAELRNKAPEIITDALDAQNKRFGVEHTDVDVKTLMQEEGGSAIVTTIADRNNITQEELQACLDGHGMLQVKTSTLQQMIPEMDQAQKESLLGNITKDSNYKTDNQIVKEKEVEIRQKQAIKKLIQSEMGNTIDNVVKARFEDGSEEANLAREIIESNFDDPQAETRQRLARVNMEIQEIVGPTVARMRFGMRQGTDTADGQSVAGENSWYGNWSADNAGRKITDRELEGLAADIVAGREDPRYSIGRVDYNKLSEEERLQMAQAGEQIDDLIRQRTLLESVQEKIKDLNPGDLAATRILSAEGQSVFRELKREFAETTGADNARKSAGFNAIMWARYCEERAKAFSEVNKKPYTAMDYYRERLKFNLSAESNQDQMDNAAQLNQPITNPDLNLDEELTCKNLDEFKSSLQGKSPAEVISFIKEIAENTAPVKTADLKVILGLPKNDTYGQTHIVRARTNRKDSTILSRNVLLENFSDIVSLARLVEISPNTKVKDADALATEKQRKAQKRKNKVENYYTLFAPVSIGGIPYTLKLTAEDFDGQANIDPASVSLYEVTTNKIREADRPSDPGVTPGAAQSTSAPLKFSIREILWNVKDFNNNYYIDHESGNGIYGTQRKASLISLDQSAYHGTGARFDRFSTDFMGTGEGAQAHGWGLYFAKDKTVAEDYRNKLTQRKVLYKGREVDSTVIEIGGKQYELEGGQWYSDGQLVDDDALLSRLQQINDADGNIAVVLRNAENRLALYENSPYEKEIRDDVDFFKTNRDSINKKPGRLAEAAEYIKRNAKDENANAIAAVINTLKQEIRINDRIASGMMLDGTAETNREKFDSVMETKKRLQEILQTIEQNKGDMKLERGGQVFEVDVPEDDVLLDEDLPLNKQPAKVQEAIHKYLQSRPDYYIDSENLGGDTGRHFYKDVVFQMQREGESNPAEAASKLLNSFGIKGIAYDGRADGRCFVVFDDKAISILNKYYQEQGKQAKGSVVFSEGNPQRIMNLFETADQSTVMHEMAHIYLLDLQELANIAGPDSQYAKDMQTVMDWANWKEGQIDDYIGTAAATEFIKRDAEIKAAEKAGDTLEAQRLKDIWVQERFARGFEEYLYHGQAPTAGLKKVFRAFKRWLGFIYRGFVGAGGRATPEVEAIMARMVASEEEIETLTAANNIVRVDNIDPDIMETDAGKMIERWRSEAREEAEELLLKELLKDYRNRDVEAHLNEYREKAQEDMAKQRCFAVQALVEAGTPLNEALLTFDYESAEVYEAELAAMNGNFENAVACAVEVERERYQRTPVQQQALYEKALEALSTGEHNTRIAALEAEIMERKKSKYNGLPKKVAAAFVGLDKAQTAGNIKALKKAVTALKYAQRWNDAEYNKILDMAEVLAAGQKPADQNDILKDFSSKYKTFKEQTALSEGWIRKEWLFGVRDAAVGKSDAIRNAVRSEMAEMPVSAAINFRMWHRKELQEGNKAWKNIANAQDEGYEAGTETGEGNQSSAVGERYARAAETAKINQATFAAMTAEAIRIKRKIVTPILNKIKKRQKTMSGKNFKMDANCRYFHDHLLYIYGLRASDARRPVGEEARTFSEWLLDMKDSGELDEEIPEIVRLAMATNDPLKDYRQLNYKELKALSDFCTLLYTTGKNQNARISDGVLMEQVEEECTKDFTATIAYQIGRQKLGQIKGAMSKYLAGLMKTETMLSLLGGKEGAYIKYIYKTLADAADKEERAREREAIAEKELVRMFYTREEMRKVCNDDLMVTDEKGTKKRFELGDDKHITKEMILCMALNWGNSANRTRLCNGLELSQDEAMDIMKQFMTEKDWQFVQAMWDHIEEYADPVSEVVEKLTGLPMKRVQAEAFTVDLGNGKAVNMRGGYYPIVYDKGKSLRQSTYEQMEQAQSMGGASVLGVGLGSTKDRAFDNYQGDGPLLLELRVAHSHIQGQIHIIHSRIPVRDAYKVISNKTIAAQITNTFGPAMYDVMKENVLSCWQAPMKPREWYEDVVGKIRRNSVGAIMAYRISTALLNLANVVYMAQEIGGINTINAVVDYYKNWDLNKEFVLNNSVFMRNRATNMDRDLNAVADELFAHNNLLTNKLADITDGKSMEVMHLIDKYSSLAIEKTDMLFSMPLYHWQFKQTYNEMLLDPNVSELQARETANYEATRRVTKVFSSNRTIDTSAVQRSRSELTRMFTPFFSFSNMMMNAVWSKYYEGKYQKHDADGMLSEFRARWGGFIGAFIVNYMLGSFVETALREGIVSFIGDDKDDWFTRVKKNYLKNAISSATGGLPLINLATDPFSELVTSAITGEKMGYNYGSRSSAGVIGGAIDRGIKPFQDVQRMLQGSQKIDMLDMMRDVVRASNSFTGFSDTLVDAMFNTVRFATDEGYSLDNMDDLRLYIGKSLFDRKLKKRS